jgi:hypothetical protein
LIHIFKAGGNYKKEDGTAYSIKAINASDKPKFIIDGWVTSLDLIDDIEDGVFEEVKPVKEKKATTKKAS